ncbi:hypothetical protein [Neomoorella humiferrea]|uniref:hypothetical protein n=1 Tax=Neomoorella humiferrea TaxID=676965 RepID=UPI0014762EB3|nr:hypothetical protein [Moorella humiferrea]
MPQKQACLKKPPPRVLTLVDGEQACLLAGHHRLRQVPAFRGVLPNLSPAGGEI